MKKLLILLIVLCFASCSDISFNSESPDISYSIEDMNGSTLKTLDSKDSFQPNTSDIYYLKADNSSKRHPVFFREGESMKITIDQDQKILIAGGLDQQKYEDYESFRLNSLKRLVLEIRRKIQKTQNKDSITFLGLLETKNYDKHLQELMTYSQEKLKGSLVLAHASTRWIYEHHENYIDSSLSNFQIDFPKSEALAFMQKRIKNLKDNSIGSVLNLEHFENQSGQLKEIKLEKEINLIEFWASWCPPCRRDAKYLAALDQQKIGLWSISLDTRHKSWINALEKDNRTWNNLNAPQGLLSPKIKAYGITALPYNFIVNDKGIILDKNIHGQELLNYFNKKDLSN